MNEIKSMYVNSLACDREKEGESKYFNVYRDAVMKEVKMGMGKRGVRFQEGGRKWGLPGLFYADYLVLCNHLE